MLFRLPVVPRRCHPRYKLHLDTMNSEQEVAHEDQQMHMHRHPSAGCWLPAATTRPSCVAQRSRVTAPRGGARGRAPDSPCCPASRRHHDPWPLLATFEAAMAGQAPFALKVLLPRTRFSPPAASCDSTWCVLYEEAQQRLGAQCFTGLVMWAPLPGTRPGSRPPRKQVSAEIAWSVHLAPHSEARQWRTRRGPAPRAALRARSPASL